MYETLVVDGVDLAAVVSCITTIDGLYVPAAPRSDNVVITGVDGETFVDKPFGTTVTELGLVLAGQTATQFNDALRTLRKLIQPGKKLSLERHMSFTAGNETHVASGEWASGLAPTLSLARFGRVTLGLKIHSGLWYANAAVTVSFSSSSTLDVAGEARTHRMQIDLPAGDSITNNSTGHTVGTTLTAGGTVTIDVETMTATQGGIDVSNTLVFNKLMPFRLVPGSNSITSTGSGTITYTPAYL